MQFPPPARAFSRPADPSLSGPPPTPTPHPTPARAASACQGRGGLRGISARANAGACKSPPPPPPPCPELQGRALHSLNINIARVLPVPLHGQAERAAAFVPPPPATAENKPLKLGFETAGSLVERVQIGALLKLGFETAGSLVKQVQIGPLLKLGF